jgi:hypothetical protein
MKGFDKIRSRYLRRAAGAVAALALAALLGGCVVYPAGPGYYGPHPYWHGYYYR